MIVKNGEIMKNKEFPYIKENFSHTDDSGLANRPDHDPNYLGKNKKIMNDLATTVDINGKKE